MSPQSADQWYAAGDAAREARDLDEAEHAYERAVALDPNHANATYRLGEIALARGDVARGEQLFRRTLTLHPGHAWAQKQLTRLDQRAPANGGATGPQCPPSGTGVVGVVQSVRRAAETHAIKQGSRPVLSFRVRVQPPGGAPGGVVAAEIRGNRIDGTLEPGDWVEFPARWRPGQRLSGVRNLTTCTPVATVRQPVVTALTWAVVLFVIVWIGVIFFVVGRQLLESR